MKLTKSGVALALALCAIPFASQAQEAEAASSPFSVTYGATTDYVFRGVSQTDNGPAFQAGVTYSAPLGFYVGAWGSNVDFGDGGPAFEVDYLVGWNTDLSDSWNLDLGVTRYTYVNADSGYGNIDYNEYIGKITWKGPVSVSALIAYANDYGNASTEEVYSSLAATYELGDSGFSLGASTGYVTLDYDNDAGRDDFFDGAITLSKGFGPATATVGYYDTFGSDASALRRASDIYKVGLVGSVTIALP